MIGIWLVRECDKAVCNCLATVKKRMQFSMAVANCLSLILLVECDLHIDLKLKTSNSGLVGIKEAGGHTLHLMG